MGGERAWNFGDMMLGDHNHQPNYMLHNSGEVRIEDPCCASSEVPNMGQARLHTQGNLAKTVLGRGGEYDSGQGPGEANGWDKKQIPCQLTADAVLMEGQQAVTRCATPARSEEVN